MTTIDASERDRAWGAIDRDRLVETAVRLIAAQSWTGQAGAAGEVLADLLSAEGFEVERPVAGHPACPAVVVRLDSGKPGRTLLFDGHIDTVHLPFVKPRVEGDLLRGSGSSDMKGGIAAAIEALLALRDSGTLKAGRLVLAAHDLHEAPWGASEQFDQLLRDGIAGDGVMIPEPLSDRLPVLGRGSATWAVTLRREGDPVHEVMRPPGQPQVIAAGARLVERIVALNERLSAVADPMAGSASAFIGQIHSGEIFNQSPSTCFLEGTRRWLPGTNPIDVQAEFVSIVRGVADDFGITPELRYQVIRDAFRLDQSHDLVGCFQSAYESISGHPLKIGSKPFVDDGNSVDAIAGVPAITHGPRAGGQHTVDEWASIEDLVRVARVYAATAVAFCAGA